MKTATLKANKLEKMIARIWHGYTKAGNADAYENLVKNEIFPGIEAKTGEGFLGVQLLRRSTEKEVEFTTMIWFRDLDTIKKLVGEDFEEAYVPEKAQELLSLFDEKVVHSQLRHSTLDFSDK